MRKLRLNGPLASGLLMFAALLCLIVWPLLGTLPDPDALKLIMNVTGELKLPPASPGELGYPWGSDYGGRDIMTRVVYGARTTIFAALLVTFLRLGLAVPMGLISGWFGGWSARLTTLFSVLLGAVPGMIFIVFLLPGLKLVFGNQHWWLMFVAVVAVVGLPRMAEQVRQLTTHQVGALYVEAAVATGASTWRILFRHILPVIRTDLLVSFTSEMAWVLMTLGQLAIFGLYLGGFIIIPRDGGLPPLILERTAEWGQMIGAGRVFMYSKPWLVVYPAVALGLTAACFHFLAEGLRVRLGRRN